MSATCGTCRASATRSLDAFAAELEGAEKSSADTERAVCACVAGLAETLKPEYSEALRRIEVDGVAVRPDRLNATIERMRGLSGSSVRLLLTRKDQPEPLRWVRKDYKYPLEESLFAELPALAELAAPLARLASGLLASIGPVIL